MTAEYIYKFVKACEAVYGTRDPEDIFIQRKAALRRGAPEGLRGLIFVAGGAVIVDVSPSLSESLRKMTLAHLLGHAVLHRKRIMSGKTYEEPCDAAALSPAEREADLFAAELLIPDDEILALHESGMNEGQLAASFGALRDLVPHKLFSMRSRGIKVGDDVCRADFLRRCDVELFF